MNVRQWVEELAPRERRLVYLAGVLVAIAAVYLIVVLPLQGMSTRGVSRVDKKAADLA